MSGATGAGKYAVTARFHQPAPVLRDYFAYYFLIETACAEDEALIDHIPPEWATLRFCSGALPEVSLGPDATLAGTDFVVTGPCSHAARFTVGRSRQWGIRLLPLGWAQFVADSAAPFANRPVNGRADPAFARFRPLADTLFDGRLDADAEARRIDAFFLAGFRPAIANHHRIAAIHAAMLDENVSSVAGLAARAGIDKRTVERICKRVFGFPPKLLLRRERFVRSLQQFMLDPSLKWIGAMDALYHDQAQFVREFRQFMGMTPSRYASLEKPIIGPVTLERNRYALRTRQVYVDEDGWIRSGPLG